MVKTWKIPMGGLLGWASRTMSIVDLLVIMKSKTIMKAKIVIYVYFDASPCVR